jgi:hypothetical protein
VKVVQDLIMINKTKGTGFLTEEDYGLLLLIGGLTYGIFKFIMGS